MSITHEQFDRSRDLIIKARDFLKSAAGYHPKLLEAAMAVHRSRQGILSWGHRKVTDENADRVISLITELNRRADVLEDLLHGKSDAEKEKQDD